MSIAGVSGSTSTGFVQPLAQQTQATPSAQTTAAAQAAAVAQAATSGQPSTTQQAGPVHRQHPHHGGGDAPPPPPNAPQPITSGSNGSTSVNTFA